VIRDINGDKFGDMIMGASDKVHIIFGGAHTGNEDGEGTCGDGVDNGGQNGFGEVADNADTADADCHTDGNISNSSSYDALRSEDGVAACGDGMDNGPDGQADRADSNCNVSVTTGSSVTINGPSGFGAAINVRNVNSNGLGTSDKIHDIIVGAYTDSSAHLFLGKTTWPSSMSVANGDQDFTWYAGAAGVAFGYTVYSGEVNGDFINDVLIGDNAADGPDPDDVGVGAAYVFFGSTTLGKEGSGSCRDNADNDGDTFVDDADTECFLDMDSQAPNVTIYGAEGGDAGGAGAVHVGNFTDDRFWDIMWGTPSADSGTRGTAGELVVVKGSAPISGVLDLDDIDHPTTCVNSSFSSGTFDVYVVCGGAAGDAQGFWVAAGDLDGNGYSDILTTAPFVDAPAGIGDTVRPNDGAAYAIFDADLSGVNDEDDTNDDNDGTNDVDDNCQFVAGPQTDVDSDDIGNVCDDTDSDSRGFKNGPVRPFFTDAIEEDLGTQYNDPCPDNAGDDAWPPDVKRSGPFGPHVGVVNFWDLVEVTTKQGTTSDRHDLDQDGDVDSMDINIVMHYYGLTCSN
jgi:hypothetical protein